MDENYTDTIQHMAAQRHSGTLEAPAPAMAAIQRSAGIERIADGVLAAEQADMKHHRQAKRAFAAGGVPVEPSPITGGVAVLNDPNEIDNAEKTARWAMQDMASQAHYGKTNPTGLDDALKTYTSVLGNNPDMIKDLKQRLKFGYADGGKIDAEALMREMAAKYGAPSSAPAKQQPAPQQSVQQPQAQPQASGLIQGATNALRARAAQIERATGYRRGGKIKGPGTATSDSIPAKVKQTGENILVSNGERILSAKQDQLLQRIAMERGFESVDQMLEHGTGEPVGPTIKAGKAAAANGAEISVERPWYAGTDSRDERTGLEMERERRAQAPADVLKNDPVKSALTYGVVGSQPTPAVPAAYSNEGRAVPSPITTAGAHPISVPASRAAAPEPTQAPSAATLTSKDIVPGGFIDRGAGIVGSRNPGGQLNVTNVGTESFANRTSPIVDGSASALIDQKGSTYNPAAQLERMQRMRMMSDLTDPTITDPNVRQQAAVALGAMNQGAKANLESAQAGLVNANTNQAQQMEAMRGKLLDPNTPLEERTKMIQALQAIGGHSQRTAPFQVHDVEEPIDPANPMLGNRKSPRLFDPNKGTLTGFEQGQQSGDAVAQAKAAIARGANKAAVNARLKALGLPEVK